MQSHILSNVLYFFKNRRSCSKEISYLSTIIPPYFQACINWKIAFYFTTSVAAMCLFYLSIFHGSTWSDLLCVYSTKPLQPSIIASGLWLIWENFKGIVFVWGRPCSFKGAYLFHRTSFNNFCLHPSHSFMVNVLIWKFTTAIAVIH